MTPKSKHDTENAKEFQMGGPTGAVTFSLFFTVLTYFVVEKCQTGKWDVFVLPSSPTTCYLDMRVCVTVAAWFCLQFVLYTVPHGGSVAKGRPLINGGAPLLYRMNALFTLVVNLVVIQVLYQLGFPVTSVFDNFLQYLTSCVLMILLASITLYVKGHTTNDPNKLNPNGQSESTVYNWFMGRELNPRLGFLDVKYVMFRSGIVGWMVMNHLSFLNGWSSGGPMSTLTVVYVMQLLYVVDYFRYEEGILVSRDIVHEGLGFNILMQFVMIPFTFCVQTRYIQTQRISHDMYYLTVFTAINLTGFYIYRKSNSEKNNFRKNPNDAAFKNFATLETSTGRKLLISGWWGVCRHPNYLGDLVISFSYAFPTGFRHFLPYLNPLTLVMLLVDREKRDNRDCERKYGPDWTKYCKIVKYRIIPGLY